MKKLLVMILALMMVFTLFTACGNDDAEVNGGDIQQEQQPADGDVTTEDDSNAEGEENAEDESQQPAEDEEEQEESKPADKEDDKKEESKPADKEDDKKEESKPADKEEDKKEESKPAASYSNAVELLSNVWGTYAAEEMFPAGYIDEAGNMVDGPANIGTSDGAVLDSLLGVPADKAGTIDNASIMMHMMNANTFTGGAFKTADAAGLSDSIKANLADRQWMCGFPDILVTIQVDDYLISAFGNAELIENFKNKVTAVYGNAKVLCEEPLAF